MNDRDEWQWTNTEVDLPPVMELTQEQPSAWFCLVVMFCGGLVGGVIGSALMAVLL